MDRNKYIKYLEKIMNLIETNQIIFNLLNIKSTNILV